MGPAMIMAGTRFVGGQGHRVPGGKQLTTAFDPHALDWSRHHLARHEAEIGPGMFLPQLVPLIGSRLLEAWHGCEIAEILLPAPPSMDVPPVRHAFDDAGAPVAAIHETHAREVREALLWSGNATRRRSGCDASFSCLEIGTAEGTAEDADLSEDDWEVAYEAVVLPREMRAWARSALSNVAYAIADMASRDAEDEVALTLIGRPLLGGGACRIDRSIWTTGPELRLRRLAACGLDMDAPFDPSATPTHLIFVETSGLVEAVDAYAASNRVPAISDDHPWWADAAKVRRSWAPDVEAGIREVLVPELLKPDNRYWRVAQAQRFIARDGRFGGNIDAIVARVCNALKEEGAEQGIQYASLGRGGRPRIGLELVRKR